MQAAINDNKRVRSRPRPKQEEAKQVTQSEVEAFRQECAEKERHLMEEQKAMKTRIRELDGDIKVKSDSVNALNQQLKDKDSECRLNSLKINEMRRIIRFSQQKKPPRPEEPAGVRRPSQRSLAKSKSYRSGSSEGSYVSGEYSPSRGSSPGSQEGSQVEADQ